MSQGGCEGCYQSQKGIEEALSMTHEKAKQFAITNGKNVFIYKTPDGWDYMAEAPARQIGITPAFVVSYMQPVNAG